MSESALTLLGRADCHLCDEMLAVLRRVAPQLSVVERDIDADPALLRRYAFEIPVLLSGDNEIARYRISEADLAERLTRLGLL